VSKYSEVAGDKAERPNDVRPLVDETDRRTLQVLAVEARLPNNALAERVGIAPSTPTSTPRSSGTLWRRSSPSDYRSMPEMSFIRSHKDWRP
jgi:hypothetical protein